MISGEGALLEKGPLSPPPSLLSPSQYFQRMGGHATGVPLGGFFLWNRDTTDNSLPHNGSGWSPSIFQKYTESQQVNSKGMQRPTHRIMDCIVSNLYRTSPSTEKNPLDAVAKSTACGYAPIMIPSFTDRLFFSPSIAGRSVPCGLCPRLTPANCLPP